MNLEDGSNYLLKVNNHLGEKGYKLLFLAISGSHAWGLQRPDSDVDLRGVYQKPTEKILDLRKDKDTIEYTKVEADNLPSLDVQLYEVEKFLGLLCKHNGNMISLLNIPLVLYESPRVPWASLGGLFLTKKLRFYYRGYAQSQRKRALSQRGGKALVYTYREMFSGLYLMRYGVPCFNFLTLRNAAHTCGWYEYGLLDKYEENPELPISDDGWKKFYGEWDKLAEKLDKEAEMSPLPDDFDGYEVCNCILLSLRKNLL